MGWPRIKQTIVTTLGPVISLLSIPDWPEHAEIPTGPSNAGHGDVATHITLGIGLAQQGDLDGAIREFRAALSLDPHLAIAHDNLERALHAKSGASVSGGSTEP
jgi:hypothetical protein